MSTLQLADFQGRIEEPFTVEGPAGRLELRLDEAHPLGQGLREGGAFALLLVGPPQPILPQAIYRLEHKEMEQLELFLVPVGPQAGGMGYEAVFT